MAEGREKEEGRLKSREKGSVSMATAVVHPPPVFPLLCRELWWSLCNAIPLECTVWISAEQCPQGSDRATVKTLLPRSNAVITAPRGLSHPRQIKPKPGNAQVIRPLLQSFSPVPGPCQSKHRPSPPATGEGNFTPAEAHCR